MASLNVVFNTDNSWVQVTRRDKDDLPQHVKGTAKWSTRHHATPGYYLTSDTGSAEPIEFVNNAWYGLTFYHKEKLFTTRPSYLIAHTNKWGLGYWYETDPQHPNYKAPTPPTIIQDDTEPLEYTDAPAIPLSDTHPELPGTHPEFLKEKESITDTQTHIHTTDMTDSTARSTTVAPQTSLKGVAPDIFTGDRSRSDEFLNQFRRFKLVNKHNDTMKIPFFRILTALSYIRGPLVEDWVNAQDKRLEECTDATTFGSVPESDEVLWTEFETAFKSAWQDTAKTQDAFDRLMKLTMKGLEIDTYNATFDNLAAKAGWKDNALGTITQYCKGLDANIHRRILYRENLPGDDVKEWQAAARKEVQRTKALKSVGLIGGQ
jgi:hypothetical protein